MEGVVFAGFWAKTSAVFFSETEKILPQRTTQGKYFTEVLNGTY